MRKILVTNALPYANDDLHLGHILGYVQSDIWVRFQRMNGNKCIFICGSDTHGTPIMIKAKNLGILPEELITKYSNSHKNDLINFDINLDNYHSTHNSLNRQIIENIYDNLKNKNIIFKKKITQAYDSKEKIFLPDRFIKGICPKCKAEDQYGDCCEICGSIYNSINLINPRSILSQSTPIHKESEHYFFDLPSLEKDIKNWIYSNNLLQQEVLNKLNEWFKYGLQQWDISRDYPYFGFTIPNTNGKKFFYVWFDAPIGYIASCKNYCNIYNINFNEFWNNNEIYHFIGKDIIYFHLLFWPAILSSIEYKKPDAIFVSGFLTINGRKMSKSRGTYIKAKTYLKYLDSSYLRYYFASRLTSKIDDIDLNFEEFIKKSNSDIIGKIINIASRCSSFIYNKFNGILSNKIFDKNLEYEFIKHHNIITKAFETREFATAIRLIIFLADKANHFIDYNKPWKLINTQNQKQQAYQIYSQGINMFKVLSFYLKPIIPSIITNVENFLNIKISKWNDAHKFLINHKINKFYPMAVRIKKENINNILLSSKEII